MQWMHPPVWNDGSRPRGVESSSQRRRRRLLGELSVHLVTKRVGQMACHWLHIGNQLGVACISII